MQSAPHLHDLLKMIWESEIALRETETSLGKVRIAIPSKIGYNRPKSAK